MVDNGCLRKNEAARVVSRLKDNLDINLTVIDAADRFLDKLEGVTDPESKRKIIGKLLFVFVVGVRMLVLDLVFFCSWIGMFSDTTGEFTTWVIKK